MFIQSNCVAAMQQKNPANGSTYYLRILCSRKYLLGILCTAFTNQKWNIQKQFRRNKPAQLSHCPDEIFRSTPDYRFEQHSAAWAAPSSYLGGSRIIYTHPTAREGACAILYYSITDLYKMAVTPCIPLCADEPTVSQYVYIQIHFRCQYTAQTRNWVVWLACAVH